MIQKWQTKVAIGLVSPGDRPRRKSMECRQVNAVIDLTIRRCVSRFKNMSQFKHKSQLKRTGVHQQQQQSSNAPAQPSPSQNQPQLSQINRDTHKRLESQPPSPQTAGTAVRERHGSQQYRQHKYLKKDHTDWGRIGFDGSLKFWVRAEGVI